MEDDFAFREGFPFCMGRLHVIFDGENHFLPFEKTTALFEPYQIPWRKFVRSDGFELLLRASASFGDTEASERARLDLTVVKNGQASRTISYGGLLFCDEVDGEDKNFAIIFGAWE